MNVNELINKFGAKINEGDDLRSKGLLVSLDDLLKYLLSNKSAWWTIDGDGLKNKFVWDIMGNVPFPERSEKVAAAIKKYAPSSTVLLRIDKPSAPSGAVDNQDVERAFSSVYHSEITGKDYPDFAITFTDSSGDLIGDEWYLVMDYIPEEAALQDGFDLDSI